MRKTIDRVLETYSEEFRADMDDNARGLISQANWDLHFGPGCEDDESYPGFSKAVSIICDALSDVGDLWVDTFAGGWSDIEPTWRGETDEGEESEGECPEDWTHVDRSQVIAAIVGKELAPYVR